MEGPGNEVVIPHPQVPGAESIGDAVTVRPSNLCHLGKAFY